MMTPTFLINDAVQVQPDPRGPWIDGEVITRIFTSPTRYDVQTADELVTYSKRVRARA